MTTGLVVPASIFVPYPDTYNAITPKDIYYVMNGVRKDREIIDFDRISKVAAKIDFSTRPNTAAIVTHNPSGGFTVEFE